MRYTTRINNVRALEWGINMTQAALFDLINECASWASTVTINGVTFYWISRQLVIEELPLVFRKEDAVYRTLKVLEEKGLVETAKMDGRDYVRITTKGAKWNSHDAPETEPRENSRDTREKNRNPRENSRNGSGKNPTDKYINNQPTNQGTNQFGAPARDPAPASREPLPPPPAKPEKFDAWAVLSGMGVERKHFDAWMRARKRKRLSSPIDEVALAAFFREIGKVGLTAHDAARMCAERGWGSIEANWDCFKQRTSQRGNTFEHQGSAEQYAQEQAERMRPQIAAMFAAKQEKRDD